VLDHELAVPRAHEAFDPAGTLLDPDLQAQLETVVAALHEEAARTLAPAA
jgi:hypothetical protein